MTGGSTPPSDTRVRRNSPNRDSSSKKPSNTPLPIHVDDPMRVGQVLRTPLANPGLMSHVTRETLSGSPLWSMKSRANSLTVLEPLPGTTQTTLHPVRSATTVMYLWPLRLVSSMPMASTPV